MERESRIYVAGHRGLVGSAIVRKLAGEGHRNVITRSRERLDLLDQTAVHRFFAGEPIDVPRDVLGRPRSAVVGQDGQFRRNPRSLCEA